MKLSALSLIESTVIHPSIGTGPEWQFIVEITNKTALRTGPDCRVNYSNMGSSTYSLRTINFRSGKMIVHSVAVRRRLLIFIHFRYITLFSQKKKFLGYT